MKKPHILIVDHDTASTDALKLLLQSWAYGVSSAKTPQEAMEKLEKERPDLVLLEVMLPRGTEGFHFVWDLRNHPIPELRTIPVIVISHLHKTTDLRFYPHLSDQHYLPGEYLPVQGFLDKPSPPAILALHIKNILATLSSEF